MPEEKMVHSAVGHPEKKPLITFALFAYNQEQYIREAVAGAFSQTYSPLEIILSDDHSSDETFSIMTQMAEQYEGPHEVRLNCNEQNLGIAEHVNRVLELANDDIVVLAAGDDIAFSERAERTWQFFDEHPEFACISFSTIRFSGEIPISPQLESAPLHIDAFDIRELEVNPWFHTDGAARGIKKSALALFPKLEPATPAEDNAILFRTLLSGGKAAQSSEKQVFYRVHEASIYSFENRNSFSHRRMHDQYVADLDVALETQMITNSQRTSIITNLERRLEKSEIKQTFALTPAKIRYFLRVVSLRRDFSRVEKRNMLRRGLHALLSSSAEASQ